MRLNPFSQPFGKKPGADLDHERLEDEAQPSAQPDPSTSLADPAEPLALVPDDDGTPVGDGVPDSSGPQDAAALRRGFGFAPRDGAPADESLQPAQMPDSDPLAEATEQAIAEVRNWLAAEPEPAPGVTAEAATGGPAAPLSTPACHPADAAPGTAPSAMPSAMPNASPSATSGAPSAAAATGPIEATDVMPNRPPNGMLADNVTATFAEPATPVPPTQVSATQVSPTQVSPTQVSPSLPPVRAPRWNPDEVAAKAPPDPAVSRREDRMPVAAAGPPRVPAAVQGLVDDDPAPLGSDQQGDPQLNEFEDVAVTIGRVVSIRGSVIWGALYDDAEGTTARAARMGALVSMRGPDSRVFGIVNGLEREQQSGQNQAERTVFEIQVLGEIAETRTGFQRGVSSYPPLDAPVTTVTLRDIATIYARPRASNVHIGRLRHNRKVPAFVLTDSLLGKHFAVLGTTGTGKSCAVTVILRSILDQHPNGHIVLLDPHNEYATAFADKAELLNPSNLQLPYWLLNFEEISHILIGGGASGGHAFTQTALLKEAILRCKQMFAGDTIAESHITVDTPTPYRLSDLIAVLRESMGMLNKAEGASPYLSLIAKIDGLRSDKRFAFMFASLAVRDTMHQVLAQLLRIPVAGKPITIIDISGVPSEIVDVVVSVLFRLTFELAVWSERGSAPPVLLVCEEAHRYVPEKDGVGFAPTKRVIARIAKEGRKYGVTLCLVSQRPSELAINSLSQCNTIFALRLSNEHDQAFVGRALSENARWLIDSLPSLNTQEAVVVGDGVTVPVHIRFKDLDPNTRPSSHDPSFSTSWQTEADTTFLDRAIDRWRHQVR